MEKLIGKGPFNLEPPANPGEESKRIHEFPLDFDFYRKDGEGGMSYGINTEHAVSAKEAIPEVRKDVLTVGNGTQVTSEESHSKVRLGDQWGPSRNRLSKDVSVIELSNGRNGVGAIRISYENLKPGQTIAVTGGSLSGCTMMYASDTKHFYAYHAGTFGEGNEPWLTSRDGANAIRYASSKMTNDTSMDPHNYEGNNNDLVHVGNKYPFSVIVYNGKHEAPATSGKFLKPSDPQPLDARITEYQGARNPGTHAFDYHVSNQQVGQLGTAEALISKDKQGVVTVRVLAENGEVELPGPGSRRGGKYTPIKTNTYEYKPGS
ncbi:cytotoxic necrotizing factor Rho-activating domain-containing protein [Caballeronia sp. KNU42]